MPDLSTIRHERERQFAADFFDHDEWEYEPGPYRLSNGTKYRPDFKDNRRNVLIEVIGSRQAFHFNREKYEIFKSEYPDVDFEFRDWKGNKIEHGDVPHFKTEKSCKLTKYKAKNAISRYILENNMSPFDLSQKMGLHASTVHRHVHGKLKPTLDMIAAYVGAGVPVQYFVDEINQIVEQSTTKQPEGQP